MTDEQLPEKIMTIPPEWIDRNGHMNVAYYVLAFDYATDDFYESLGIGAAYQARGYSVFTLGINVDYRRELFAQSRIRIKTQLISHDQRRLHYYHWMFNMDAGYLAATNECISMNIDLEQRRGATFPDDVRERLTAVQTTHNQFPKSMRLGRSL